MATNGTPPKDLQPDPTLSYIPQSARTISLAGSHPGDVPPGDAALTHWTVSTRPGAAEGAAADLRDLPKDGYVLTGVIGHGGMGEVWEALQVSLSRVVAVKRLRRDRLEGLSSEELQGELAEFRKEAVISAQLEHPHIVPVHDIGADAEGMPLLAMKRVQGRPWNTSVYSDFKSMGAEEFLAEHLPILIQVSQAVAFAHSKGIIHRDLKPSQVMTGEFGEVMLMDWGLAVYVGEGVSVESRSSEVRRPALTTPHLPTRETASNPSGTPALMAPEQTESNADNIGPWTDIYLLGGTLYLLLTGTYPHAADTADRAFALAALGIIDDPRTRAPGRQVPDDLAELCMLALRKEPKERIESASAFVKGLQDYLTGAGRRRESTALVEQAVADLGQAGANYHAIAAGISRLQRALNLWPGNAEAAATLSGANEQFARAALRNGDLKLARVYGEQVADAAAREAIETETQVAEARARALARQRRFALAAAASLAAALILTGFFYANSQARARERIQLQRDLGEDVMAFMMENLSEELRSVGRLQLLEAVAEKSLGYYDQLSSEDITADGLRRRALAFRQVGDVLRDQGRLEEAVRAYTRAEEILAGALASGADAAPLSVELARTILERGQVHAQESRPEQAKELFTRARDLAAGLLDGSAAEEARLTLAAAHLRLGGVIRKQGELGAALEEFRRALDALNGASTSGKDAVRWVELYGEIISAAAEAHFRQGDVEEAISSWQEWLAMLDARLAGEPESSKWLELKARALKQLVDVQISGGAMDEAGKSAEASIALGSALLERDPTNDRWRHHLAITHLSSGRRHENLGDQAAALDEYQRSVELLRPLLSRASPDLSWRNDFVVAISGLGNVANSEGNFQEAEKYYQESTDVLEELVALDPSNSIRMHNLASSHGNLANVQYHTFQNEKCIASRQRAMEILSELMAQDATHVGRKGDYVYMALRLGQILSETGRHEEALAAYAETGPFAEELSSQPNADTYWMLDHAELYLRRGQALLELGRRAEARAELLRSAQIADANIAAVPGFVHFRNQRVNISEQIGKHAAAEFRFAEAIENYQLAIDMIERLLAEGKGGRNDKPVLAGMHHLMAEAHAALGHGDESVRRQVLAADLLLEAAGETDSPSNIIQHEVERSLDVAQALLWEDPVRSREFLERAAARTLALGSYLEGDPRLQRISARQRQRAGHLWLILGNEEAARAAFGECLGLIDGLAGTGPLEEGAIEARVWALGGQARLAQRAGDRQAALALRRDALTAVQEWAAGREGAAAPPPVLFEARMRLALALEQAGRPGEALETHETLLAALRADLGDGSAPNARRALGAAMLDAARCQHALGRTEESRATAAEALVLLRGLHAEEPLERRTAFQYGHALLLNQELAGEPGEDTLSEAAGLMVGTARRMGQDVWIEPAARVLLRLGRGAEAAPLVEFVRAEKSATHLFDAAQADAQP